MRGRPSTVRSWLRAALTVVLGGLSACVPTSLSDESETTASPSSIVTVEDAPVKLRAWREYRQPNSWSDGEQTLVEPLSFALPARLRVTQGNAGNHKAELWYRDGAGHTVNCDYRGGSDEPHPTSDYQRALGQRYVLERCSNGARAGDTVSATWVKLHVRVGDQKDPVGRTEVELKLGGTGDLEPPVDPADSIQLRDAFSWERTQPVAETNAEGYPALYYALIYVEERDHVLALDELLIHHDGLPLFAAELERWKGQRGFFQHEWDGKGLFRFALVPGAIYNRLRAAALQGHIVFRAVVLQDIPAAARGADGSISYAALRASAFLYRDEGPTPTVAPSTGSGPVRHELFGIVLRRVVKAIAEVAEGVVEEVRKGIGELDRYENGSVELTVKLDMRNVDPAFIALTGPDAQNTPMRRAWGPKLGHQVSLPKVKVVARQHRLEGLLTTVFTGETGEDGIARIKVARGQAPSFCVAVENDAAEVSNFQTEIEHCDFTVAAFGVIRTLNVKHPYFNILAQASEGREYLEKVVAFQPHQARILVGPLTWPFTQFTGGVAPCFGLPNLLLEGAIDVVITQVCAMVGSVMGPQATPACMALYPVYPGVDIVLGTYQGDSSALYSRHTPTHEYGHFALCSMLTKSNLAAFTTVYSGAMLSRMDAEPDETNVPGYVNEAFADFFASQVAGGTGYFSSPGDWSTGWDWFCVDGSASCLESNIGKHENPSTKKNPAFNHEVARVASTLHDAFDSWQQHKKVPTANVPGNGVAWWRMSEEIAPSKYRSVLVSTSTPPGDIRDEFVRLPGGSINELIKQLGFGDRLDDEHIMGGLSELASEDGFSWCERCQLFAVNDKTFAVDDTGKRTGYGLAEMEARCMQAPIRDWLGPKSVSDLSCDTVSIAGKVLLQTAAPAAGVLVTISLDGALIAQVNTNPLGVFRFDGLTAGQTYQVKATHKVGTITYEDSESARAVSGRVTSVSLVLATSGGGGGGGGGGDEDPDCYIGGQRGYYCACAGGCVRTERICRHICED